ncbi:hypothetical protein R1flu_025929 [Riccia fluitans]|uniref:Uncharacterized protein n=1 Tax=Riccia fluitans TaxID=41844 RepID=A0ABD1XZ52_9MARC
MELLCFKAPLLSSGFSFGGQPLSLRLGISSHGLSLPSQIRPGSVVCKVNGRERRKAQRLGKSQEAARKRDEVGRKREEALIRSRAQVASASDDRKRKNRFSETTLVENLENLYSADFGGVMSVGVLQLREEEEIPVGSLRVKDLSSKSKLSTPEYQAQNDQIPTVSELEAGADTSLEVVHERFTAVMEETLTELDGKSDDDDMEWVEVGVDEDEEEGDENVEIWEGDLPPMTPEEEEELLREAEKEIAELERAAAEGRDSLIDQTELGLESEDLEPEFEEEYEEEEEEEEQEEVLNRSEKEMKLAELKRLVQQMELEIEADNASSGDNPSTAVEARGSVVKENKKRRSKSSDDGDWEVLYAGPDGKPQASARKSKFNEQYSVEEDEEEVCKERGIPAVMRCFDRAKIYVKAGNGGNGVVAFRREKFVPFGGPSGGTGGRGGHVYIEADSSMNSLLPFRNKVHFRAGRGAHGGGKSKDGAAGTDITIKVPPGTIIRESSPEGKVLLELTKPGQRQTLLPGGAGGRGNAAFKTGRNNAPQLAEFGEEGTEMWVELELKLVADVGIVGVPNAGKSTLLSAISAAKPEIANYPFTTLLPNLGVVAIDYDATMVVADLPGLLEGAHTGVGLGHEFMRHTERCRVLVHVVDGMSLQPEEEYEAVRLELQLFNPELAVKPHVVAFNKMDIPEAAKRWESFQSNLRAKGVEAFCMSAATREGTEEVIRAAHTFVREQRLNAQDYPEEEEKFVEVAEMVRKQRSSPIEEFTIVADKHTRSWQVNGAGLERFTQMTNWEYFEAVRRFQHVLAASGVNRALRDQGVKEGDTVRVGQLEFQWLDSEDMANLGEWKRGVRGSKVWPH